MKTKNDVILVAGWLSKNYINWVLPIDIESLQNRLLKVCYVASAGPPRFLFLLQPLTVIMKQTRQVVRAILQSILLRCLWGMLTSLACHVNKNLNKVEYSTYLSKNIE